jgi:hypothetical protein
MYIHLFGAAFGLAVAAMLKNKTPAAAPAQATVRLSTITMLRVPVTNCYRSRPALPLP